MTPGSVPHNFGPASAEETIVFGASRPGAGSRDVPDDAVTEWLSFMAERGIKRVVCLLPEAQLEYYSSLKDGLLIAYRAFFGAPNVLHVPVPDWHLAKPHDIECIRHFCHESVQAAAPVVVHCSGGSGRTGHVLAAWLTAERGCSPDEALREVCAAGASRDPFEAIQSGNATQAEFIALLSSGTENRE